ncbi:MAG TPA: ATP-binding protein [Chloroflexota bacterium]|jgi:signal transduction histidine kinase
MDTSRPRPAPLKTRVAMDLHDTVLPSLTGLAAYLAATEAVIGRDPASAPAVLRVARAEIQRAIEVVRGYMDELDPPRSAGRALRAPGSGDLRASLTDLAAEAGATSAAHVQVSVEDPVLATLSAAATRELTAIAREAVTNAVRHGRAATVWITLRDAGECALLTIRDDGAGLRGRAGGRGLRNIAARAAAVGGRAVVTSKPEVGTLVWVTVPHQPNGGSRPRRSDVA